MVLVDKNTMTESPLGHHCYNCGLTIKDMLQFISSLILPLMLAVFTIIITIQQQHVATKQRMQDLNNSAQQRAEDRQMAIDQRVQDKSIAKEQREQDELRRLQDLKIAEEKWDQDNILAEKERDMLEKQRTHELAIEAARYDKETEKYLDALLVTYMNEIGTLFMNNNGSLTSNLLVGTLVRLKTLTIARQLDPSRNTQLVQFLYEAGQLFNGQNPLDLSDVNFDGINLSTVTKYSPMQRLSLCGAHLNNASFHRLDLKNANFSNAHLKGASFVDTYLEKVDFSYAILFEAEFENSYILHTLFEDANMVRAKFTSTSISYSQFTRNRMEQISIQNRTHFSYCNFTNIHDLSGANLSHISSDSLSFTNVNLRGTVFANAKIPNTHFINTELDGSDFSCSDCQECYFKNLDLNNVTFVRALLSKTIWFKTDLTNIDFTGANLEAANFVHATILKKSRFVEVQGQGIMFSGTYIESSNFSSCQCSKAEFIETTIFGVSFSDARLKYANFSSAVFDAFVTFYRIDGFEADFSKIDGSSCNFAQSRLVNASFAWAAVGSANFSDAEVNGIDFSHAILQFTQITQEQLDLSMSISGAYFQDRNHRNPNLVMNNGYECNTTEMINNTVWKVKPSGAIVMMTPENGKTCSFTVTQPVIMSQLIYVSRYQHLIDKGRARCHILTNVWNISTIFYVTTLPSLGLSHNHSFQVPERPGIQLLQPIFTIPQETTRILLYVVFETAMSRCGYIDLSVQDDNTRP